MRFVAADARGEAIVGVTLAAVNPECACANAQRRGLLTDADGIRIGSVRFDLGADERS